jgi:hypothetical protein
LKPLVESVTGLNNAAKLGAHICAVLWCGSLQLMLVDWSYNQDVLKASLYAPIAFAAGVLRAMLPLERRLGPEGSGLGRRV